MTNPSTEWTFPLRARCVSRPPYSWLEVGREYKLGAYSHPDWCVIHDDNGVVLAKHLRERFKPVCRVKAVSDYILQDGSALRVDNPLMREFAVRALTVPGYIERVFERVDAYEARQAHAREAFT